MAKSVTINNKIIKFFRAYLSHWLYKANLTKSEAALRFSVSNGQLIGFLNNTRSISIAVIEKICARIGVDVLEALEIGRRICGEEKPAERLTPFQIEALSAFRDCLIAGGEGAEILAQNAITLARKKQVEIGQKPTKAQHASKSA